MSMSTTEVHTRNAHDNSLDIATGQDIASGQVVGRIAYDHGDDMTAAGYVLRWYDAESVETETELADDAAEAVTMITRAGYDLDADSACEIATLAEED